MTVWQQGYEDRIPRARPFVRLGTSNPKEGFYLAIIIPVIGHIASCKIDKHLISNSLTSGRRMASGAGEIDQSVHPYTIVNSLTAGVVLCLTLATLTTAIRLYTKFFIIKSHGWEDCEWRAHAVYAGCGLISLQI